MKLPANWQSTILHRITAPAIPITIYNLTIWNEQEGGTIDGAFYNPFNCGLPQPGSVQFNRTGVQVYPSWSAGLNATVTELLSPTYTPIRLALRNAVPTSTFKRAVMATPWGTVWPTVTGPPRPTPSPVPVSITLKDVPDMAIVVVNQTVYIEKTGSGTRSGNQLIFTCPVADVHGTANWKVMDITDALKSTTPSAPPYLVE